jgi:hypothetical protein
MNVYLCTQIENGQLIRILRNSKKNYKCFPIKYNKSVRKYRVHDYNPNNFLKTST